MSGFETAILLAIGGAKALTSIAAGENAYNAAKAEAKQLQRQAGRTEALSQRVAIEERRKARLVASRLKAVAGASGAGIDDPTVVNLLDDVDAQGEFNMLSALYEGTMQADTLRYQAKVTKQQGKSARTAGYVSAIAEMGSSLYGSGMFEGAAAPGASGQLKDWTMPTVDTDLAAAFKPKRGSGNPYGIRM